MDETAEAGVGDVIAFTMSSTPSFDRRQSYKLTLHAERERERETTESGRETKSTGSNSDRRNHGRRNKEKAG